MAFLMTVTISEDITITNAFWKLGEVNFNLALNTGSLVYYIYKDQASATALKRNRTCRLALATAEEESGGVTYGLNISDVWGKTVSQIDTLMRTKTVQFENNTYDLTGASDVT